MCVYLSVIDGLAALEAPSYRAMKANKSHEAMNQVFGSRLMALLRRHLSTVISAGWVKYGTNSADVTKMFYNKYVGSLVLQS
jgi:hypothetical protein